MVARPGAVGGGLRMSLNGFVLALSAVVIGLGLADLLTSFHKLLRAGRTVKWDWLALAYAAYMLFGLLIFWWWQFNYPAPKTTLTIVEYLPNFLFLALAFLMVASALPDQVPAEGIDLKQYYSDTVVLRWGLLALSLTGNLVAFMWTSVSAGRPAWFGFSLLSSCVLLALAAIRYRARWFHALVLCWLFAISVTGALLNRIGS